MLLSQLKEITSHGLKWSNSPVLCFIIDPVALVSSNQEKATFDLFSLAIVLCSFLSADLIIVQEMED
ncbi:hypothetical protein RRG08_028178 [Elysia crispata]|uniref:Uncharacterized protein n=1 Tax=Elysia crispata TaxID=231223 RepID=A0AAE0Y2A3_9GAST|nr:hypothetical protein RRG08_028178 [Elysia crispata]